MGLDLNIQLDKIINSYDKDVQDILKKSSEKVAKETVKELKQTSPKKTGLYAKSWKVKSESSVLGKSHIIMNSQGQLTHLLEHGHGLRSGGRTRAFPHIKPAEQNAIKSFEKLLKNAIEKI